MTGFEWKIFARRPDLLREGEVKEYTEATLTPVYNDVGTWSMTMDARAPQAANLAQPRWGIIVTRNGQIVFSGRVRTRRREVGKDTNKLILSGLSDEAILKTRLVSPSPAEGVPPYTVQASDIRTGVASTILRQYVDVNAGPGAIVQRRIPGLTIDTDPVVGASVTGNGRWDSNLLAFLQPLATAGGIGFRVAQVGAALKFQTYAPTDRTATVKFSVPLKNLSAFEYELTDPEANYIYVGASGSGTARVIQEFPDSDSIATYERIEGDLVDNRGTSDPVQIAQTAKDALTLGAEQVGLSITPIETPTSMYGVHYYLGDKVTVQLEDDVSTPYAETGQVQDIIRSVVIKLTVDGPQTVTPAVGTPARSDIGRVFRVLKRYAQRINNLERVQ